MKPVKVLPFILPLLPLAQVSALELKDELLGLSLKRTQVVQMMNPYAARFQALEALYAPADAIMKDTQDKEKWEKYRYPDNIRVFNNQIWKLFRIIDEMDINPLTYLSPEDRQVLKTVFDAKKRAVAVQKEHCPTQPMETEDSGDPFSEDWYKRECWTKTSEYIDLFGQYVFKMTRPHIYKQTFLGSQESPNWTTKQEYELKLMADGRMTNADWMHWFTKEVAAADRSKGPVYDATELARVRSPQARWTDFTYFYMRYTRPANKQAPTGLLDFNTPEEGKKADAFVKKRVTWQYHRKMVVLFTTKVEKALPDDEEYMTNARNAMQDIIDEGGGLTQAEAEEAMIEEFEDMGNNPERDPKFQFKKTKGLDPKLSFMTNKHLIGGFLTGDFSGRKMTGIMEVLKNIEKVYDPKLHPWGRKYIISDMIRRSLNMEPRKTFATPARMRDPVAVDPFAAERNNGQGQRTGPGRPQNPGNDRKLSKVRENM